MRSLILFFLIVFSVNHVYTQKKVIIYWDVSYSMIDRNLERELNFLNNYFNKNADAEVNLIMFSNEIIQKTTHRVVNSSFNSIKEELSQSIYDGSTSYSLLFQEKADEYVLFTDGKEVLDKLIAPPDTPVYIVSSLKQTETKLLRSIANSTSGGFIYLNNSTDYTTKHSDDNKDIQIPDDHVIGTVSDVNGVLHNVSIINKNNNESTASDALGNYSIKADEGDILVFTYLGRKTVRVEVQKADIINITMDTLGEELDEVLVTTSVEKVEMVNTGNQKIDKRRLGYDVQTISSDEISETDLDAQFAVKGQFAGLIMPMDTPNINYDLTEFRGRHLGMTMHGNEHGLVVIDGVPQEQSISAYTDGGNVKDSRSAIGSYINPDNIASITYLKGLAATNKYGSMGKGGVILITTKTATATVVEKNTKALGTTATYTGNAEVINELPNTIYNAKLLNLKDVNDAFATYLFERENHGDDPNFYIDLYEYFKGWNNQSLSTRVISNTIEIAPNDPVWLRAVAYKFQESGDHSLATKIFEHIESIAPNQSQTYRDLALSYSYLKEHENALEVYKKIQQKEDVGEAIFSGLANTIKNETKNFVVISDKSRGLDLSATKPVRYKSRIVFEWNNYDAEFDVNIVNPQNRFFTWSNTKTENPTKFSQQKREGFGLEEFFLTDSDVGSWKFNLKYYGNGTEYPTYLKITTIDNFGQKNQRNRIKVVRLDKTNVEQEVSKILIN